MRTRGTAAAALGLWICACTQSVQPDRVKKVEHCLAVFSQGLEPGPARVAARSLIEEAALTEEAVDSVCRCHSELPPQTPQRDVLVSELLEWIKTWDNTGRPKYLSQFFGCFADEASAAEARRMAAAAFYGRLERVSKDEQTGLRAVLLVLTKALGDGGLCVFMEGRDAEQKPLDRQRILGLFAGPGQPNAWLVSGLELAFEPREDCPAAVKVEFLAEPDSTPEQAGRRARVNITRNGIFVFDKEYHVSPTEEVPFSDFLIPLEELKESGE